MDDVATVEQFGKSMSKCGNLAVAFANSLFTHANVDDTTEKMAVVKNSFAALCVLQKAWCTAARPEQDALYLLNRTRVPRNVPQHILNANNMTNGLVGRILDDVVGPYRKLDVSKQERVALTSLIVLDGDCRGLSPATQDALSQVKDRVQSALFQYIRERCEQSLDKASSRFAKILLLLPSIAKVSVLYSENVAFAKMLGTGSLDVELARRLEHEKTPDIWREMIDTSVGALSTGISSTKPQTCTMCKSSEVFEDVHELEAHITADHFGCTPYECEKCSTKKFATEHLVREHYEKDHRLREYYIRYRVSPDIESRREQAREVLKMSTSSLETVKSKEDATLTSGPVATNDVNGTDGHLSGSATRSGVAANVNAGAVLLLQERDVYHTAGEQASEHQR